LRQCWRKAMPNILLIDDNEKIQTANMEYLFSAVGNMGCYL
jgi:hypothetical protein